MSEIHNSKMIYTEQNAKANKIVKVKDKVQPRFTQNRTFSFIFGYFWIPSGIKLGYRVVSGTRKSRKSGIGYHRVVTFSGG